MSHRSVLLITHYFLLPTPYYMRTHECPLLLPTPYSLLHAATVIQAFEETSCILDLNYAPLLLPTPYLPISLLPLSLFHWNIR